VSDETAYFTIGQLARQTGVPARTIRFWSDTGIVQPARRTAGGYRLYDPESAGRLDLVRSLRALGFGLGAIKDVLDRTITVAQVAELHIAVLDGEIRTLRLRRAVLRTVANRGATMKETQLMHKLSRLSAQERQQLIDEFVDRAFAEAPPGEAVNGIARSMRQLPADLPDDPDQEQVDAWVELAELVNDEAFQQRVRQMALAGGGAGQPGPGPGYASVMELAGNALSEGITPGSAAGQGVLDRIVGADTAPAQRASMLEQLETFTDARVERYWQLAGIINGRPPFPSGVPAFEWVIAALRAHARPDIR
jgi:DNA-binding transcriptional MerR regulator